MRRTSAGKGSGSDGAMNSGMQVGLIIAAVKATMFAFAYLLPIIVAAFRRHPRQRAIVRLNLLLGWTGIGWLYALAWAFLGGRRRMPYFRRGGGSGREAPARWAA